MFLFENCKLLQLGIFFKEEEKKKPINPGINKGRKAEDWQCHDGKTTRNRWKG
jgi:hypothetical protein